MSADARHLSDERLLRLVDGELPPRRAAAARRHLASCAACRSRAARIDASADAFARAYRSECRTRGAGGDREPHSRDVLKARLAESKAPRRHGPSWLTACAVLITAVAGLELLPDRAGPAGTLEPHSEVRPIAYLTPGAARPLGTTELCALRRDEPRAIPAHVRQAVVRDYRMELVSAGEYELDYLITPELGGSDDRRNLWPERYSSQEWNARVKDELEELLPRLVCAGTVSLAAAQRDLATDWIAAYKKYFHTDRPLHAYAEPASIDLVQDRFAFPAPRHHQR